ncbi:hypothetical protein [Alteraurantiacibacter aestuarii]|uniref:Uncharacterized protein n=1 Tax=Alteraurantiacibacter aestuarii TaxID=650004 RepID=A0A844ZK55_9SPHN|nr:hypothetical protein [Alteraurantiacibacter aestuarii]MXO87652.1 hypothetical protein [Alteraurantiacibacter aestuarii]
MRPELQIEAPATQIVPPADVESYDDPESVTLKAGTTGDLIRSLEIRRSFSVEELRRNPEIQIGPVRANMRPVLQNPDAPVNLASRLRQRSALVTDVHDSMDVMEASGGLIIRQFLTYRMLPRSCSDSRNRQELARAGASCFTRMSEQERTAARANPASARYVSGTTIPLGNRTLGARREAEAAEIATDMASLRAMLRDPAQRATIEREIGAEDAARYARLTDEELEAELVNTAVIQLEETMFVPSAEQMRPIFLQRPGFTIATPGVAARDFFLPQPIEVVDAEHAIPDRIFLTGFTVNRSHEWRKRVSVTINWCVVSCKKTYYVEMNAGFDYGFGLRLPIEVGGTYSYNRTGNNEQAHFTATIAPVNGSAADFSSTALPADQLFNGQELVAEVGARAGFGYKVPAMGTGSVGFSVTHDFTDGLPSPFTNGQFAPPAPGQASPPSAEQVFRNIDLIGGRANFWFVGARIHPSVKLGLTSDRLEMLLTDNLAGTQMHITRPGQRFDLAVDPISHASSFTIAEPTYNLGFTLTPGITVNAFVDVKAWSKDWDWDIWFPQLSLTLPPGGHDFGCHAETICSRSYNYSPDVQQEEAAQASLPSDPLQAMIVQWQREFLAEWQPRCPYQEVKFCEVAVNWVSQKYGYRMTEAIPEAFGQDVINLDMLNAPEARSMFESLKHQARQEAIAIIEDSEEIR